MMNDEIKALESRIEKLESIIVYLVSAKGLLKRNSKGHPDFDEIFDSFLNDSESDKLAKLLIKDHGGNKQLIVQTLATTIHKRLNEEPY